MRRRPSLVPVPSPGSIGNETFTFRQYACAYAHEASRCAGRAARPRALRSTFNMRKSMHARVAPRPSLKVTLAALGPPAGIENRELELDSASTWLRNIIRMRSSYKLKPQLSNGPIRLQVL